MSQRLYSKYKTKQPLLPSKPPRKRGLLSNATINDLPPEIMLKIISMLHVRSLQNATLVCKKWRDLANDNQLWEVHFKHFFGAGAKSMYSKLKMLALRPDIAASGINWKGEFLSQCEIESKKVLSKLKRNFYTGVTDNLDSFFSNYNVRFQLRLTCRNEEIISFLKPRRHSFSTSTYLQWNSLNKFPSVESVQKFEVFAICPLILKKNKKCLPLKRSLILSVDTSRNALSQCSALSEDIQNKLVLTSGFGIFVAKWTDSSKIAFVSVCLHHHNLINKCFLSSIDAPYFVKHKPIEDDVDTRYGLHGYQCHIAIHTTNRKIWENKFSYLICNEEAGFLLMRPDVCHGEQFVFSEFNWRMELFEGSFTNMAIVSITLMDTNKEIIWATSEPGPISKAVSDAVSFEFSGPLYNLQVKDSQGFVSITFCKEDSGVLPKVTIGLSLGVIKRWFGKS